MPRLKTIDPKDATGKAKELFDGPLKGKHLNIFKAMANSPAVLDMYVQVAGALSQASLSEKEREAIALAVSEANGCGYCLAAHTFLGKNVGLSEEQTLEARRGDMKDERLDALVTFALALKEKSGWVSDGDIEQLRGAGFDDGAVAEVVAVYAQTLFTNVFNHVNDTDVDLPAAPAL